MNGIKVDHTSIVVTQHPQGICGHCKQRDVPLVHIQLFECQEVVCKECLPTRSEWLVFRWLMGQNEAYQSILDRIEAIKRGHRGDDYDKTTNTLTLVHDIYA